jgi:transposase
MLRNMARRKISHELWSALEPLIPVFIPSPEGGCRRRMDDRAALNGIRFERRRDIPLAPLELAAAISGA